MNFSLALTNLILGVSLNLSSANDPADLVRDRLDHNLVFNGIKETAIDTQRRLVDLHTDFNDFTGDWYNCLHTTLMTFNGEPAEKHIVDQVGCDGGKFGNCINVGNNAQTLQFDIYLLNHCFFHDLGGTGQPPCPDDIVANDPRGNGNVLVKYSFNGIGSFTNADRIEFTSDHTYLRDEEDVWVPNRERAKIENRDTLVCEKYKDGIVCDWRITEYRTSTGEMSSKGCKEDAGDCNSNVNRRKCLNMGGKWTKECPRIKSTPNGFVYDSFGSYYLVKNMDSCNVECSTTSPTSSGETMSPELKVTGCYMGGRCKGCHGCCDCGQTEEECNDSESGSGGTWQDDGCRPICNTPDPVEQCLSGPSSFSF